MDLESVELIMEVEETFGVAIGDEEAQRVQAVGDLCDLIVSKFPTSSACGAMAAFNWVRRGLIAVGVPRRRVTPEASLASLLPARRRHACWKQVSLTSQLKLPDLRRPLWVKAATALTAGSAGLALFAHGAGFVHSFNATALFAGVLFMATRPAAVLLPDGRGTVGELADWLADTYGPLTAVTRPSPEDVWSRLVEIVAKVGGVDPEKVTREAGFFKGLHFGG